SGAVVGSRRFLRRFPWRSVPHPWSRPGMTPASIFRSEDQPSFRPEDQLSPWSAGAGPSKCAWILSYSLRCYFAISLSVHYEWMHDGPSHKPPLMRVVSGRWFSDEPAVFDQDLGCIERGFWVPEGGRAKLPDISHPDDVFIPALDEPV